MTTADQNLTLIDRLTGASPNFAVSTDALQVLAWSDGASPASLMLADLDIPYSADDAQVAMLERDYCDGDRRARIWLASLPAAQA